MEKYSTVVLAQSWTPFFSPSTVWLLHLASCLQIRTAHGSSQILSPVVDLFSELQTHKSNCQIKPPLKRQIVIKLNMLKAVSIHRLLYYSPTFSINGNFILLVVQANIFDVIPVFCLFLHPITYHQEILLVRLKKYRNTVIILSPALLPPARNDNLSSPLPQILKLDSLLVVLFCYSLWSILDRVATVIETGSTCPFFWFSISLRVK